MECYTVMPWKRLCVLTRSSRRSSLIWDALAYLASVNSVVAVDHIMSMDDGTVHIHNFNVRQHVLRCALWSTCIPPEQT